MVLRLQSVIPLLRLDRIWDCQLLPCFRMLRSVWVEIWVATTFVVLEPTIGISYCKRQPRFPNASVWISAQRSTTCSTEFSLANPAILHRIRAPSANPPVKYGVQMRLRGLASSNSACDSDSRIL